MEMNGEKVSIASKIKSFMLQSKRVWHVLSKPSKQEFWAVSKVAAVGILAIGLVGFIISNLMRIFF
ncbi:MAG: protein translocase SEC61 complex subunit gamma [Nanoarchaeota archaeon]